MNNICLSPKELSIIDSLIKVEKTDQPVIKTPESMFMESWFKRYPNIYATEILDVSPEIQHDIIAKAHSVSELKLWLHIRQEYKERSPDVLFSVDLPSRFMDYFEELLKYPQLTLAARAFLIFYLLPYHYNKGIITSVDVIRSKLMELPEVQRICMFNHMNSELANTIKSLIK